MQDLLCQRKITLSASRPDIVKNSRFAMARGLAQGHIPWNYRRIDFIAAVFFDLCNYLMCKTVPRIAHSEQHPFDIDARIKGRPNKTKCSCQKPQPFKSIILTLNRDQYRLGSYQRI